MSGYRVSETVGANSHSNDLYDSEEDSVSEQELDSSSSDMLNQMNEIDSEQIFRVRQRKASLTVQLPKDMCPIKV